MFLEILLDGQFSEVSLIQALGDLESIVDPVADYIAATDDPHVALIAMLMILHGKMREINGTAEKYLASVALEQAFELKNEDPPCGEGYGDDFLAS